MRWAPSQLAMRAAVVALPLLGLLLLGIVGGHVSAAWVVVLLALLAAAVYAPDSGVLAVALLVVMGQWVAHAPDQLSAWVLVLAACLLGAQVAAICTEYGPRGLDLPRALLLRWAGRMTLAMAACAAALGAARAVEGRPEPPGLWGLVVIALVAVVWVVQRPLRLSPGTDAS